MALDLGMPVDEAHYSPEGAQVTILDAGRATLEIVNPSQQRRIDQLEVGRPVAGTYRLALEVTVTHQTTGVAVAGGAVPIAPPTRTPWGSPNHGSTRQEAFT